MPPGNRFIPKKVVPAAPRKPAAYNPDKAAQDYINSIVNETVANIDKTVQGPVANIETLTPLNLGLGSKPTLDPKVRQKERELRAKARIATRVGVPSGDVAAIAGGKGDPNRGFLGVGRSILGGVKSIGGAIVPDVLDVTDIPLPFTDKNLGEVAAPVAKTVGIGALKAAAPGLDKLDVGRRFFTSLFKEFSDELAVQTNRGERGKPYVNPQGKKENAGFSVRDLYNQTFAGSLGLGDKYKADSPEIIQEAKQAGITPKELAKIKNQEQGIEGGEFFSQIDNPYVNQLLGLTVDVLFDPLSWVSGPGGIGKTAVTRAVATAGTKGGIRLAKRVAVAEARQYAAALAKKLAETALDDAVRIGDDVAAEIAKDAITAARKESADAAKMLAGDAAARTIGRTSNQAVAETVLGIRDEAQKVIDLGTAPAGELAAAERAVEVLTDGVIKNIQGSGLAGISGPLVDILKGTRTAAQDVLGVRGGVRLPNPLSPLGVGTRRVIIPGTETITNVAGKLLSESRLGVGRTALGVAVLNNITPTGEGGLLGSADLLRLRTGLRNKTLSAVEAQEATRLLQADKQYRALVNNERKVAAGILQTNGVGRLPAQDLNEVLRIRQVAASTGAAPAFTPAQKAISDSIDKLFSDYYAYSAKATKGTGYVPPFRADYFPQLQSDKAIRWAQRFPKKAEELAKKLNVDRTWFVGNFRARELAVGDEFFGKVLTQADLDGGAATLNNIARKWGLTFDYFETNVKTVINKYANKQAQFAALQKTLGSLPETLPSMAARDTGAAFVTPKVTDAPLPQGVGLNIFDNLGNTLDPAPVLESLTSGELNSILDDVRKITDGLNPRVVDKKVITDLVDNLQARLDQIADDFTNGLIPAPTASVATDEIIKTAKTVKDELDGVVFNIVSVPATRWSEYASIVKRGFEILNDDIIDPTTGAVLYKGTAPDIAVREELAELLRNATRMEDPAFAARARQLALDYTRFAKAWLTARPGFHTRNATSNVFQLVAAGANPANLKQAITIQNTVNKLLKTGKTPRQVAEQLVNDGKVPFFRDVFDSPSIQEAFTNRRQLIDALEDSINYSGATGFGQFGEIAQEVGIGNRGVLQYSEPKNKVSRAIGKIPQGSRALGTKIEDYTRFGLMWDGIKKGLSPAEAAARSDKFLIDYADLSNVDKVAKQIIPFWTFMSRNTPLQLELMWTNPRAYALYSNTKRQIEDKEEQYIPSYEKERGVFAVKDEGFGGLLPGNLIKPGLPFPGGGENVLQGLINEPKKFLASVNPILRAPVEAFITGEKFFTGGKVVPKEWTDQSTNSKLKYLVKELFSPSSAVQAFLKATPGVGRQDFMEDVFGLNVDQAEPLVQEVNGLLSLLGLPVGTLRVDQQIREIESRIYDLGDRIDAIKAREKKAREDKKEKRRNAPKSNVPYDPDKAAQDYIDSLNTTP